jgi:prevent-host-death family protein
MRTLSLSEVKAHLSELAEEVDRTHERVLVTKNGRDYLVVMSVADLESVEATLELLTDPDAQDRVRRSQMEVERGEYLSEDQVRALVPPRDTSAPR